MTGTRSSADLFDKPFKWNVEKSEGIVMFPDMILNIDHDGYKKWYLEFRGVLNDKGSIPFLRYNEIYGMIAMTELNPTDKFTVAVNTEKAYDYLLKRPPLSLRANLYVMLIDLDNGKILKEEMLCKYSKE